MTNQNAGRQKHIDCASGLLILHMMFFHLCGSTISETLYYYPILHTLSFFMAWFFFKSGMFYKERKTGEVFRMGLKRLVVPALVFSAIGLFCYLISKRPETSFANEIDFFYVIGAFRGIVPLWFLLSLFVIQLLYSFLHQCKLYPTIIALLSLVLLFTNKYIGLRPVWAYNIPLGLFFYSLGHLLKDFQYSRIVIIICIIVYLGLYFIHSEIDFLFGKFKPFVVAVPWALAGCILTNVLFKSFPRLCIVPLQFLGRHAMEFMCTHMIVITLMEAYLQYNELAISSVVFEFIVFTLYLILFSLILNFCKLKHIQWMFGKSM